LTQQQQQTQATTTLSLDQRSGRLGPPIKDLFNRVCATCKRSGYEVIKTPVGRPLWYKLVPFSEGKAIKYQCKRCQYRKWEHSNPEKLKRYRERRRIKLGVLPRGVKQRGVPKQKKRKKQKKRDR
jgi:hypothetical protein